MTHETKRRARMNSTVLLFFVMALASPLAAQIPPCGDGVLDPLEECDEGLATGAPDSCCALDCTFRPALTPCRTTTGECDPADVCSGSSGGCADVKRTDVCRAPAGICDIEESCDGVASDCPADLFASGAVECRASIGVCDIAESCTGSAAACPADAKSTAVCRAVAGVCDLAESCDGVADACPSDLLASGAVECRAGAGVCDVAELCSGASAACPADAKSGAMCRSAADGCDIAETCDGIANACPADGFVSAAVECRPDTGDCDVVEHCTGSSASCPADGSEPDETPCDDANVCSLNDRCIGGICGGFLVSCGNGTIDGLCLEECDDGNQTPGDGCTESCLLEPCGPEPLVGCRAPVTVGKASVSFVKPLNPEKNRMQWKYTPGATTPKADFGDPITTTSYQFCVYDEVGGDPQLRASYAIPAGGVCGLGPCWVATKSGFKYVDKSHAFNGILSLVLKEGLAPFSSKIVLAGRGTNLPMPVTPLMQSPNVVMQLKASNGVCWETRYATPAFRNQSDQFRDK